MGNLGGLPWTPKLPVRRAQVILDRFDLYRFKIFKSLPFGCLVSSVLANLRQGRFSTLVFMRPLSLCFRFELLVVTKD